VSTLLLGQSVLTPWYIALFIALPLVVIFLKEPLGHLLHKKKPFPDGIGGFVLESFFEMFEVLLSFVSNTMSFLRVGGFILSHAGMMAVVMTLSGMVGAGASPVVIVIGNLFVMALEGLIVGIQVLRLEFYEIFSRFYDGDGKPFTPVHTGIAE
ncbi:MAG: ATPase, partial [Angelakisella sp.]